MSILPSQVQRLQARVWLDVNGTWVDLSDRLGADGVTIPRGSADESSQGQPMTITLDLDNRDGALTPGNPNSIYYPHIKRGMSLRYEVEAGSPHLTMPGLDGSYAWTADTAALDITGDVFVAWDVTLGTGRRPTGDMVLPGAKFTNSGSQRSWKPYINVIGQVSFRWSTTGANEITQASTVPWPIRTNGRMVGAIWLDVSNAGNHVVTWYTGDPVNGLAGPWTIHDQRTIAGTTSIFSSTARLEAGTYNSGVPAGSFNPFLGRVHGLQIRSGDSTGDIRAHVQFANETAGATSFVDNDGLTWTVEGTASIDAWQPRFVGEVAEWRPTWPHGDLSTATHDGEARVTVVASGILRRLTQGAKPLNSALARTVNAPINVDNVVAYWPFEDGSDATQFASPTPGIRPVMFDGDIDLAGDDTYAASAPLPTIGGGKPAGWVGIIDSTVSATQWRLDMFARIPTAPVSPLNQPLFTISTTGTAARWAVSINDTNFIVGAWDALGNQIFLNNYASDPRFFNTWALFTFNIQQNGGNVDWHFLIIPIPLGVGFGATNSIAGTVGRPTAISNSFPGAAPDGFSWGHAIVTTGLAVGWLAPADTAYIGEPATQRIVRLCEEEGIPVTCHGPFGTDWDRVVAEGVQAMGPQRVTTLTELLQDCAAVDLGHLVEMRHASGIAYRAGRTVVNQTPVVLDAATNDIANPFEPALDDQGLRNSVTAKRPDGSTFTALDQESIDEENLYDEQVEVNVADDLQLAQQAAWRVHLGTWPGMRYRSVSSELTVAPHVIDKWLSLDVGDRLQVTNLPPQHPISNVDLIVQGYSEAISPTLWTPQLNCSPGGAWDVGVLGDDVYRVDTDGSELHTAIDDNDTSLSVAVTDGPMWITDPAKFPFDAALGGEHVTVTDIDTSAVTFGSVGTAAHANNANVTPGIPSGVATGNLLVVFAAIRNSGAGIPNTPTGYTRLPAFPANSNAQLFAKIAASGSETAPTISFSGGVANADTSAQMIRLGGLWHDPANVVVAATSRLNDAVLAFQYQRLIVPENNCIVLLCAWKQDDWSSVDPVAGFTEIGEPDTTLGDDQGIVWGYQIQTTATAIPAGTITPNVSGGNISRTATVALRCDRQTWTVTRGTNGVTKSHAAGTAISVAYPLRSAV